MHGVVTCLVTGADCESAEAVRSPYDTRREESSWPIGEAAVSPLVRESSDLHVAGRKDAELLNSSMCRAMREHHIFTPLVEALYEQDTRAHRSTAGPQSSKLMMRVRLPLHALDKHLRAGSPMRSAVCKTACEVLTPSRLSMLPDPFLSIGRNESSNASSQTICRCSPNGRGSRLRNGMLWVRIPPSAPLFANPHLLT